MRTLVLGSAALSALIAVGSAQAADLPRKAPPPVYKAPAVVPPPLPSWTGFYIGIEGGGGWGRENFTDNNPTPGMAVRNKPSGGIFGGQLGYRYQTGQFVFGVEGTGAWADLKSTFTPVAGATDTFKVRSLYTATGQVGWAFLPEALLYAKGGWAGASTNYTAVNAAATASGSQNDNGWTVGAGLDYAVLPNVVLGVEYDHFDLKYSPFTAAASNGGAPLMVTNTSRLTIEQVVGRLSYKFNLF